MVDSTWYVSIRRILQIVVTGIFPVLGRRARMQDLMFMWPMGPLRRGRFKGVLRWV